MGIVQNLIRQGIEKKCDADYQKRLESLRPSFDAWIREKESDLKTVDLSTDDSSTEVTPDSEYSIRIGATSFRIVPMHKCAPGFSVLSFFEDIIVFCNGELTETAFPLMEEYFRLHPSKIMVTGDEDIAVREPGEGKYDGVHYGSRRNPYFKPEWSPGEFASHFYFCNIVAVRRIALRALAFTGESKGAAFVYHNLSKLIFANEFNARNAVGTIGQVLIHASDYANNAITDSFVSESAALLNREGNNEVNISAVIHTKNNVPRLKTCLDSLAAAAAAGKLSLEIIVVDDRSPESSRRNTVDLQLGHKFTYKYLKEETSLSYRTSLGIQDAHGHVILIMHDGIMFKDPAALANMYAMADYKFSGVTGVKQLKAGTDRIVHAGQVITRLGLMNKLKGLSDLTDHGTGYNRFDRNVSAVSFDCVMIKRKLFEKLGGFDTDVPEAYKAAAFCLKSSESGYYNAVCNSVSVDVDLLDAEFDPETIVDRKLSFAERLNVYQLHPMLRSRDPFYSQKLLWDDSDVRILPACEFDFDTAATVVTDLKSNPGISEENSEKVHMEIEYAGVLSEYMGEGAEDMLYLQGMMWLEGYNNACFVKSLLLRNDKISYYIPVAGCYRSDAEATDGNTENLLLSGFALKIPTGRVIPGTYQLGASFTGGFPRQRSVNYTDVYLVVNK